MLSHVTEQNGAPPAGSGGESSTGSQRRAYRWRDQIRDTVRALGPEDTQPLPQIAPEPPPVPPGLVELLRGLGIALLNSADSAATTTEMLQDVAAAYDVDLQAMVMPTGILFRIGAAEVDLVSVPARSLRLDQIAEVNKLIALLQRAAITPAQGLNRLHQILTSPARFGPWTMVAGQVILSVGFGLLLNPDLLGAAVLCRPRRFRRGVAADRGPLGDPVGGAAGDRRLPGDGDRGEGGRAVRP